MAAPGGADVMEEQVGKVSAKARSVWVVFGGGCPGHRLVVRAVVPTGTMSAAVVLLGSGAWPLAWAGLTWPGAGGGCGAPNNVIRTCTRRTTIVDCVCIDAFDCSR